jgi:DNA polymerase-3 subunit gamma/tau
MDAASNNGVESIRDIRDEVIYAPSSLKKKVYIIDEVHMLSVSAFNALLKTLEEPPEHVVFILATTELQKLPATIVSRCQRFDFRRISTDTLVSRLQFIAEQEGLELDPEAARSLAKLAQGGMRDAISLFELCAGNKNELTAQTVIETIGSSGHETIAKVLRAVHDEDYDTIFAVIDDIVRSSKDISVFWNDMITYCRNILVFKSAAHPEEYLDLTENEKKQLAEISGLFSKDTILYFLKLLNDSFVLMQHVGAAKRNIAEMALIRMGDESLDYSNEAILSRISKLENEFSSAKAGLMSAPVQIQSTVKAIAENVKAEAEKKEKTEEAKIETIAPKAEVNKTGRSKLIRGWAEIADRVTANEPAAAPFLKMSRAYLLDDGRISVRFNNSFAKDMFERSGLLLTLCAVLGSSQKMQITQKDVELTVLQGQVDETEEFDDIVQ